MASDKQKTRQTKDIEDFNWYPKGKHLGEGGHINVGTGAVIDTFDEHEQVLSREGYILGQRTEDAYDFATGEENALAPRTSRRGATTDGHHG